MLLNKFFKDSKFSQSCKLLGDTYVISNEFLDNCIALFGPLMTTKAETDMKSGKLFQIFKDAQASREKLLEKETSASKKEDRKKKAIKASKSGGGTQGREVKMKAVKKKYRTSQVEEESEDVPGQEEESELQFMTIHEIEEFIEKTYKCYAIGEHLSKFLQPSLNEKYKVIANQTFSTHMVKSTASVKKVHSEVQQSLNTLYSNIVMFDKGLNLFKGEDN